MKASPVLSAIIIAGVFVGAGSPAYAKIEEQREWLPEIRESASLSSPVLVAGGVVTQSGDKFPAGAAVQLVAYPSAESMERLEVGDSFQVTPVAKAFVDAHGEFELRIDDEVDLDRFVSNDGLIDFEVRIMNGEHYASYAFTEQVVSGSRGAASDAPPDEELLSVDLVALVPNEAILAIDPTAAGPLNKTQVCGETLVNNYGSRPVTVGGTYTGGTGRTGKFVYNAGSSSTLGQGVSVSGASGSYSASGTRTVNSTSTVSFAAATGSRTYQTYFTYGRYSQWCHPVYDSNQKVIHSYVVKPIAHAGGSAVTTVSMPAASQCVGLATGSSFTKSSSAASTFTQGASLSAYIGINLSSRTGYSTSTAVTYSNSSGSSKQLCGTSAVPAQTPGLIVLK